MENKNGLVDVSDCSIEATDQLNTMGATDGLPIVLPTEKLVQEMLEANGLDGSELIGRMPPKLGIVSSQILAANAVLAGCKTEYFPVVIAMAQGLIEPSFNLTGVSATTHPCTSVVLVSGPIRKHIGMNLRGNSMGEGNQASATIGRAARFAVRNIGGGIPGITDLTTQGSPGRFGMCFAENEEDSPFPPFHSTRGFEIFESSVTLFACEGPHNVNDHSSLAALDVLEMIAGTMATYGTNDLGRDGAPLVTLGVEHALMLDKEGFTRKSIQQYLFEHARVKPSVLPESMRKWLEEREDIDKSRWSERGIPLAASYEDFSIVVTGGPGRHSSFMPSFGFSTPVSVKVEQGAGIVCDC